MLYRMLSHICSNCTETQITQKSMTFSFGKDGGLLNVWFFPTDIDECAQALVECDHNCTNINGSYYCTCMDGYALESDNYTCTGNDCI